MQNEQERDLPPAGGRKRNLIILLSLFLIAAILLLISRLLPSAAPEVPEEARAAETEGYLYILLNHRLWGIEPLGEERDVTVDQGNGVVNVIHLLPDGFYMASSTCDNQLCVTEGTVTLENYQRRFLGDSVYCLPHGLQLRLVVPGATTPPDAPDI